MAAMVKGERLVIRLEAEDDAWLASEAERLGVGKAVVGRMLIRSARMGRPLNTPGMLTVDAMKEQNRRTVAVFMADPVAALDESAGNEAGAEPVDEEEIADIVQQRLAEAEQTGRLAPVGQSQEPAPMLPQTRGLRNVARPAGKEWMSR